MVLYYMDMLLTLQNYEVIEYKEAGVSTLCHLGDLSVTGQTFCNSIFSLQFALRMR